MQGGNKNPLTCRRTGLRSLNYTGMKKRTTLSTQKSLMWEDKGIGASLYKRTLRCTRCSLLFIRLKVGLPENYF